jgi:translocation and assembly module TamB
LSRHFKIVAFTVLGALLVVLAAGGVFVIVAQSGWFKNKVRERIVSVTERATGGRVEIGRFDYNWRALTVEVTPFTLHGTEPASDPPLFRADKIQIGLKIISALKKQVDIASLRLTSPRLSIAIARDGSSNIPSPLTGSPQRNWAEQLLNFKVQRFEARDGVIDYNSQKFPLDVQAEGLQTSVAYQITGPRYLAAFSAREMRLSSTQIRTPMAFAFASKFALQRNSIQILETSLSSEDWNVHAKGTIEDLSHPRATFDLAGGAGIKALKTIVGIPLEPTGDFSLEGRAIIESNPLQYNFEGKLTGRGLGFTYNNVVLRNVGLASRVAVTSSKARLEGLDLSGLGGHFRGSAGLLNFKQFALDGAIQDLPLRALAQATGRETGELNGILNGPLHLSGVLARSRLGGIQVNTKLEIAPAPQSVPLEGAVAIDYDQSAGKIQLGSSHIDLGSSHVDVVGTLGERLSVHLSSKNLNDFIPIFPLFGQEAPEQLPVALQGGLTLDGTVSGPLANPRISGTADIGPFALDQRQFDHVNTAFDVDRSAADFRTLVVEQGKMRLEGQGHITLQDWRLEDSSGVSALLSVSRADIKTLADLNGVETPVTGSISGTVHVSGTFESPLASATLEAQNVSAYGEHFDSVRADLTYTATALEVSNAELRSGIGRITVSGAYNHTAHAWSDGSLRFEVAGNRLNLAQVKHVQDFRQGLGGEAELRASGTAKIVKGVVDLTALSGRVGLRNALVDGRPYGNLELTANTRLPVLAVGVTVNLDGIQMHGNGEWRLDSGYPGQARIEIPRVPFSALHDLAPEPHARKDLPFDGFLQGEVKVAGPLNNLSAWKADITLSTVQLNALPNAHPMAGAQPQDLVLRNSEPVHLDATSKGIDIRSASFTAKETTLTVSGRLALDSKTPWDVSAQGRINLSILQIFNPDLLASGESVFSLRVQGPLTEPDVEGRLELQKASLFLQDFSNGVNDANGLILFDRNRATVQNLTATTGGGKITFENGSFVGFRGAALLYRVQVTAENVRYRSQDGVSLTVNAALGLVGTSDNSVLSGSVTVMRTVFNPRTDVGSLLASTAKPVSEPSTNEYLRGIQFDVRVVSAPSLELETSLTRNIQADVNLRVRGTPDRPVILGGVSVSSGEIEFFGNKYSINRGEVNFYNPARIEPVIDMDLETKVRGIAVDISFAGSLNKMNFSYRSDPPLQPNEIIALLAVGRTPTSTSGALSSNAASTNTAYLATGSNPLLGQAIAPSSRLEKLFGVGHIKIDPQFTDITSVPQARLTFEQQVSADITLTYITNIAVTNQQIVRIEYDLSKRWSVIALRDENGAFGIDFLYKKRFK